MTSAAAQSGFVPDTGAEVAFAGRSNAGKSSALNRLTRHKSLARTSKTPGRTQLINFFSMGSDELRLVDLPGYGFAKVPDKVKRDWGRLIDNYLAGRQSLRGLVIVMDMRHPLKDQDLQLLHWCAAENLPVHCLLTKVDRMKSGAAKNQLQAVKHTINALGSLQTVQAFSSKTGAGVEILQQQIAEWLSDEEVEYDDLGEE